MKQTVTTSAPNVILITIDSLRYDHLGCYGYHRDTSPNIDALAARGVRFLGAVSNGGHTSTAFPSIMASALPPLEEDEGKVILQRSTTLAKLLKSAGYHTAAFHSNPWLSRFYGYGKGFDMLDDSFGQSSPSGMLLWIGARAKSLGSLMEKGVHKAGLILWPILTRLLKTQIVSAGEVNNKSMSWLETHTERFFLWLHYMDVHHPYMPTAEYLSQFRDQAVSRRRMKTLYQKMLRKPDNLSRSEVEMLVNLYDAEIKYTDEAIGSLLDRLGNLLNNTVVIITADHGDEFGEHGRFGHQTVYDGLLHVPLIIAGPGIKGGTFVKQQVSLIDLPPTIVELVGIKSPRSFRGKSLLAAIEGKEEAEPGTISTFVYFGQRNVAYRVPDWKYILTESLDGSGPVKEEVYDLRSDPGETRNLHGGSNQEANRFELEARGKIAQFKHLKVEESADYEKQRIRAKLSKLRKP